MKALFSRALGSLYKKDRASFNKTITILEDLNCQDEDGRSILVYAVLENDILSAKTLISRGANVNLKDNNGWSPLHFAVNEYHLEIAKLLVESGAEINAKDSYGNTVIWRAVFASKGRGEIIDVLLKNGANPDIKNNSGVSARSLAETIGNYDVSKFLK